MRRHLRGAAALLALVFLAACGGGSSKPAGDATARSTSTTAAATATTVAGTPTTVASDGHGHTGEPADEHAQYTAAAPPPSGYRPPDVSAQGNTMPIEARITPPCVERGKTVTIVVRTRARASVDEILKYPNGDFEHVDNTSGKANADGLFTWKVVVPDNAGAGEASVFVASITNDDSGGRASGTFKFVVAAPGGCP